MKILVAVFLALTALAVSPSQAQSSKPGLECEVLEVSAPYKGDSNDLSRIRYAVIRHKNAADRQRLSQALKAHGGADVVFSLADAQPHRGVLRRLRMCFGRGLLLFTEAVEVREREVLVLEIPAPKK